MNNITKIAAITAIAVIGILAIAIATSSMIGAATAKPNPIKGSTTEPGHHGCAVGSNGFIHSKGKCFHLGAGEPEVNATG